MNFEIPCIIRKKLIQGWMKCWCSSSFKGCGVEMKVRTCGQTTVMLWLSMFGSKLAPNEIFYHFQHIRFLFSEAVFNGIWQTKHSKPSNLPCEGSFQILIPYLLQHERNCHNSTMSYFLQIKSPKQKIFVNFKYISCNCNQASFLYIPLFCISF